MGRGKGVQSGMQRPEEETSFDSMTTMPSATPSNQRLALALGLGLSPWPLVSLGLYGFHSAVAAFALYHVLCLAGGGVLRSAAPISVRQRFPLSGKYLALFVLLTVFLVNAAALLLYPRIGSIFFDPALLRSALIEYGLPPTSYTYLFPYFALVNPTAEEFFWRGSLYPLLRRRFGASPRALILTNLFFASWHYLPARVLLPPLPALLSVCIVFLAGVFLTWIYENTHRLGWPIVVHALAADIPLLVLLWLMRG